MLLTVLYFFILQPVNAALLRLSDGFMSVDFARMMMMYRPLMDGKMT